MAEYKPQKEILWCPVLQELKQLLGANHYFIKNAVRDLWSLLDYPISSLSPKIEQTLIEVSESLIPALAGRYTFLPKRQTQSLIAT